MLEHTADVGIRSSGQDLEEAFEEVAKGMFSIITDISLVDSDIKRKVEIKAYNSESLLVNFLSELIYLHEVNNEVYGDFDISITENEQITLKGDCLGERIDLDKHDMDTAVKAVSYHELEVDPKGEIKIILDI